MVGWNHTGRFKEKPCKTCLTNFKPASGAQLYCSEECGFAVSRRHWKTEAQYELISGNWKRYVSRLVYCAGRKRDQLTREILLEKLEEQDYRCAISGVPLTCNLTKGTRHYTNASVDRINPGGPYTKDNIQLVCRAVNSWRSDLPLETFFWFCEQVVKTQQERLEGQNGQA